MFKRIIRALFAPQRPQRSGIASAIKYQVALEQFVKGDAR